MNDLNNTQDVIFSCEIIENRSELIYNAYDFNP